jgi:hypothetical protein
MICEQYEVQYSKPLQRCYKMVHYLVFINIPTSNSFHWGARGEIPTLLGSPTVTGPVSRFFSNCDNQCFVDLSSWRQLANVASLSWSGRHCLKASRALQTCTASNRNRQNLGAASFWAYTIKPDKVNISRDIMRIQLTCFLKYVSDLLVRGVPVPTAWRVLGLRMEEWPPAMEVNCEYIE